MLPVLQIGPAAIQLPGLLLLVGVWVGSLLAERQARRLGLPGDQVERLIFVALIAGVIGARLGYALNYLEVYLRQPLALLALTPFTLAPEVGAAVGLIAAVVYAQRKGLPLWGTMDALTPGLASCAVGVALAHLAGGDAFGAPSSVPWAIELWGTSRHPTQVYELVVALTILWLSLRVRAAAPFAGFAFGAFVALTAAARLVIEGVRGDSVLWFGSLRAAQIVSLAIVFAALSLIRRLAQRAQQPGL